MKSLIRLIGFLVVIALFLTGIYVGLFDPAWSEIYCISVATGTLILGIAIGEVR